MITWVVGFILGLALYRAGRDIYLHVRAFWKSCHLEIDVDEPRRINLLEHVCEIRDGGGDLVKHESDCPVCNPSRLPPDFDDAPCVDSMMRPRPKVVQCSPFTELGYKQRPPWETGEPWVEEDASGRVVEHNRPAQVFGTTAHQAHLDILRHFAAPYPQIPSERFRR